jgi:hypothetical protein
MSLMLSLLTYAKFISLRIPGSIAGSIAGSTLWLPDEQIIVLQGGPIKPWLLSIMARALVAEAELLL